MSVRSRRQVAKIIVPALILGGASGAGVGLGWYPPAVGVGMAVVVAVVIGVLLTRLRGKG